MRKWSGPGAEAWAGQVGQRRIECLLYSRQHTDTVLQIPAQEGIELAMALSGIVAGCPRFPVRGEQIGCPVGVRRG